MTELFYRNECITASAVASIIIGVIAAALGFTGIITIIPAFLWVTFAIAIGFLGITLLISPFINDFECMCALPVLFGGIIGTVLTSLFLLGTGLAITGVAGAIFFGLLIIFLFLIITSVACLIKSIVR